MYAAHKRKNHLNKKILDEISKMCNIALSMLNKSHCYSFLLFCSVLYQTTFSYIINKNICKCNSVFKYLN